MIRQTKKTAVVSCFFMHNYGSMLQAYATQKILDNLGVENETFHCILPRKYMQQSSVVYMIKKLCMKDYKMRLQKIKMQRMKAKHPEFKYNCQIRNQAFERFKNEFFRLSSQHPTYRDLCESALTYDAFIVGSDQLWKPDSIEQGYYTLEFVPDHIKKISYATSFGVKSLPKFQYKRAGKFLNRFYRISVREESGKDIVDSCSNQQASVVLDPTLLLNREDWEVLTKNCNSIVQEPYIFVYFLGNNPSQREIVKVLKQITGCKIVSLLHIDEYIATDEEFPDLAPYDVGPAEFLNLIKNASYICTDSFHASVFSIIFEKKFFVMNRFDNANANGTNTRIDHLLSLTGLEERRLYNNIKKESLIKKINDSIDYPTVKDKIEQMKVISINFLQDALQN